MTANEYDALRTAAMRRAHLLREQAIDDFWAALMRRLARIRRASTSKVKLSSPLRPGIRM